jgi:CRP/FNR family cyclic AMP-dependent transcriptional regulator
MIPLARLRAAGGIVGNDKTDLLRDVSLFRACSPKELEYIARNVDEVEVPAGKVLAEEGKPGHEFFLIIEGTASVSLPDGEVELGPGQFFGEMSLLDNEPRVATVTAKTDMKLLVLGQQQFSSILAEIPSTARSIMRVLAQRLRNVETGPTH